MAQTGSSCKLRLTTTCFWNNLMQFIELEIKRHFDARDYAKEMRMPLSAK
jgi:hypothetical protein